jgi:MoxR-like ATPase
MFAQALPQIEAGCAQIEARAALSASLAAHDRRQQIEAARRLGRAQGQALALREHREALAARRAAENRALTAALEARIAHQRSLTPIGPIRIPIRLP